MSRSIASVDDLMKKKQKDQESKKIVFLSKEERAKLALERRQQQVQEQKQTFSLGKRKEPERNPEYKMYREKYLGETNQKVRKVTDRKKFVFDWNEQEDTSADANPLYAERHSAVLFGRGRIAGIDTQEQNKSSAMYYATSNEKSHKFDERHWSDKSLDEMTQRDWRIFREDFSISTKGGNMSNPIRKWTEAQFPQKIINTIEKIGYTDPTPIQRQAIPIQLENRDLIGIAETGSGKTASFVIPMLVFISELPPITYENAAEGPYGLILAPTRELAQQIEQEASKFAKAMGFICVSLVGGRSLEEQGYSLRSGVHIVIATPGRLKDAIDRRILALNQCTYIVMDEADRMFEMNIDTELRYILDAMPLTNMKPDSDDAEDVIRLRKITKRALPYRQTVMFSATMPPEVERLAKQYMRRPAIVTIGIAGQVVDRIEQRIEMIDDDARKVNRLTVLLKNREFEPPVIIFVNQKKGCDYLTKALDKFGFRCTTLHSGKSQEQREAALQGLKSGRKDVLIATDVAGRGIDVKNVSLVVNYDMSKSIEGLFH